MSELFDDLKLGLEQAIAYERGAGEAKKTRMIIMPVKSYSKEEIRQIRMYAGMTQSMLAEYMGVSNKTVEAWENGRTHPTGAARRLLEIIQAGYAKEAVFVEGD